jgi:hypothetical protein
MACTESQTVGDAVSAVPDIASGVSYMERMLMMDESAHEAEYICTLEANGCQGWAEPVEAVVERWVEVDYADSEVAHTGDKTVAEGQVDTWGMVEGCHIQFLVGPYTVDPCHRYLRFFVALPAHMAGSPYSAYTPLLCSFRVVLEEPASVVCCIVLHRDLRFSNLVLGVSCAY